jgi:hypothetical protein
MSQPPSELDGAKVLRYTLVDESARPTGNCKHWVHEQMVGPARALAICQYEGETGYYLFSCDSRWQVLTDTWHETMEDTLRQADFEYEEITMNWRD